MAEVFLFPVRKVERSPFIYHSTDLDTKWSCCGSQSFLPWNFKWYHRKMTMKWPFSYNSFVKLSLYNMIHL